jgi:hypothetical protein
VNLAGEDFIKKLKPDDVMNVPEFHKAYVDRMTGDQSVLPFRPRNTQPLEKKEESCEKYDEEVKQYHECHPGVPRFEPYEHGAESISRWKT